MLYMKLFVILSTKQKLYKKSPITSAMPTAANSRY